MLYSWLQYRGPGKAFKPGVIIASIKAVKYLVFFQVFGYLYHKNMYGNNLQPLVTFPQVNFNHFPCPSPSRPPSQPHTPSPTYVKWPITSVIQLYIYIYLVNIASFIQVTIFTQVISTSVSSYTMSLHAYFISLSYRITGLHISTNLGLAIVLC